MRRLQGQRPTHNHPGVGLTPLVQEANMRHRIVTCIVMGVALSSAVVLDGQSTSASAKGTADRSAKATADKWSVPRMPDGRPDLQGVWANNNMTPLQRPPQFAGRATMTDAELTDLKQKVTALMDGGDAFFADELILAALDGKTKFRSADTQTGNYDQSWLSERIFDNRTSLIIDPPDGRIPPLTSGATERARAQQAAQQARGPADRAQDLSFSTRCVSAGTPNIRAGYQSYFEITQGPDVVALRTEMIHDARIFQIGAPRPFESLRVALSTVEGRQARGGPSRESRAAGFHVSPAIRLYHGDSRAYWDGDTLVVDTTNYVAGATRVGAATTEKLRTTEKFRRVAEDTIEYYITFDDPDVWSRPWTMMIPLKKTGELMFEFACHEGNYGLRAILSGARAQEGSR
jgi:hypothetical protein